MRDRFSRINFSSDKKEALQHFLVDLMLSDDRDIVDNELLDKLLQVLRIEMSHDDKDEFIYWTKDELKDTKREIQHEKDLERQRFARPSPGEIRKQKDKEDAQRSTFFLIAFVIILCIIAICSSR